MGTKQPCPICREEHEPRSLSFDGVGVNSCGMYRSRLTTFSKNAPREVLGPMFAAAPMMLAVLKSIPTYGCVCDGEIHCQSCAVRKAIQAAEGDA